MRLGTLNASSGLVLLLVIWLGGCASLSSHPEPIRVTVSDLRVIEATMLEQLYGLTLRVQNPNDTPIEFEGMSFELAINGLEFGSGVSDSRVTVPAFGDAKVEVRLVSTLFRLFRHLRALQEESEGPLSYELSGRVSLADRFGRLRFREHGELDLRMAEPRDEKPLR
jgi:LEA14-like dessication related protein